MTENDRRESMWYCPACGSWVGWKLDECVREGHSRPRRPLYADDVGGKPAWEVTRWDRLKAKLGWF